MNVGTLWEHRVQVSGDHRHHTLWPVFFNLKYAEDFVAELNRNGLRVTAIISTPISVINATGGSA